MAKLLRAAQSGSEPEKIGLAPEPEPLHQLSCWSRAVSGPSRAVTTLALILSFPCSVSLLEYCKKRGGDIFSDIACKGSDEELSDWDQEDFDKGSAGINKCIVLHPSKSAYAAQYVDFNPFAGEPLVDNRYVDNAINYLNATFVPFNENMQE